ncbi:MAG: SDR family NAD(P)-dependent oxidoreductase [Nitrospirae bacterium]|nr:SDR family NAD(P)-dependent oxidoreductase [Nitrospirota bacterium]
MEKVVIITGASRGLGKGLALKFGKNGKRVLVNYKERKEGAEEVAEEINKGGGEAITFRADVRETEKVKEMVDLVIKEWGRIDILINNAGIVKDQLLIKISEEVWDEVIETNLKGPFNMIRAVSKVMIKQKEGHIINISSISGIKGRAGQASYAASKAGLIGLTKTAAIELGRYNIKVNAVLPGLLMTDMVHSSRFTVLGSQLKESVLERFSDIERVADFICNLSEIDSVSGQVFNLDSRVVMSDM